MKVLKYLTMLFAMACMSMPLTGCSDDDEDEAKDAATLIAGDYSGTLSVMGSVSCLCGCFAEICGRGSRRGGLRRVEHAPFVGHTGYYGQGKLVRTDIDV